MNKNQKRIALFFLLVILIICGIGFALKFFHIGIFHKRSSSPESEFVNTEKLRNSAPNALSFDFEADPKSGDQKELYKGIAHTGLFSAKVFGKNSFSIVIVRNAGDIGLENLKAVALSAWIYIFPGKNDVESSLVFSASTNGINLTWQGVTLHGNDLPRGKWFKISGLFNLSEIVFKPETKLQFYFWNNSSNDILMDDMYVVFGGPRELRGDSALVDMTKGVDFVPKFNFPPYPFHFFTKDEVNNENSQFLVNHDGIKDGEILSTDKVIPGYFTSSRQQTEDILVIKKEGKADLFIFNKNLHVYQKVNADFPADVNTGKSLETVLKGNFTNKSNDQIIGIGQNSAFLISPEKNKDINASAGQIKKGSQLRWSSIRLSFPGTDKIKGTVYSAADLNGDKITELLAVHPDGSWKIYAFTTDHPSVIESGKSTSVAEWNEMKIEKKITAGMFLRKYPQDVVLTVFREKEKHNYSYMLSRFDPGSRSFISCFPEKNHRLGKTIGLDTLKPNDEFFTGTFDNSGVQKIFRYNRDWRYDLKEIRFNDTTFQVLANMDFSGYANDHNPKYFETLKIFSGTFLKPGQSSLLLLQKNPAKKDFMGLPEAIQIYSLSKTE